MARRQIIVHGVQLFVLEKGRLAEGQSLRCKGASEACQLAEEKVRIGRAIGAAAFTRTIADPDFDDGAEPTTLATFGQVPPEVAERLPF